MYVISKNSFPSVNSIVLLTPNWDKVALTTVPEDWLITISYIEFCWFGETSDKAATWLLDDSL